MRIHSSRHNAFNTGLIPANTALTTLAIPSVVVPQHAVIILLNAGSCLCSLRIRYRTGLKRIPGGRKASSTNKLQGFLTYLVRPASCTLCVVPTSPAHRASPDFRLFV